MEPRHNPATQKRIRKEKRDKRCIDRKHVGGGSETRLIKDQQGDARGRSRSKSPRRNCWREEIRQIKSWKDERENREIRFEDIRHERKLGNRGRASQMSSKCLKKTPGKKFNLLFSSKKLLKRDGKLVSREAAISRRLNQQGRERQSPPVALHRMGGRLNRWRQVKKSSNIVEDVEVGLVTRRKDDERESVEQSQPPAVGCVGRAALGTSSKESADVSDDELELRISDKDIFPELRDQQDDRESAVPDVVRDGMKDKPSSQRSVKLIDDNDENLEDVKMAETARAQLPVIGPSKSGHESRTVTKGSSKHEDSFSSTSSDSNLSDEGSSAMARNFSLLELKMEVYTTRLKELEWEREQLRKEREVFQDKELFVKRDLVKSLVLKNHLIANVYMCEKENKENKG